jgi:Zn finger protein HypA/HybF involved in hydrogenase expression
MTIHHLCRNCQEVYKHEAEPLECTKCNSANIEVLKISER